MSRFRTQKPLVFLLTPTLLVAPFAYFSAFGSSGSSGFEQSCRLLPLSSGSYSENRNLADRNPVVVTLNIAKETRLERILEDFEKKSDFKSADVLLLQEVKYSPGSSVNAARELAAALGMNFVYAPENPLRESSAGGLAILSRYPIENPSVIPLKHIDRLFNNRCRMALAAVVRTASSPIRIVNVHLDTRINSAQRLEQLHPVLDLASQWKEPVIIGGDLNTANILWIRNFLPLPYLDRPGQAILKKMQQLGFHTPFISAGSTFDRLPVQLDWIYLKNLKAASWSIQEVQFSDHHALVLKLNW